MIQLLLPAHLAALARTNRTIEIEVPGSPTINTVLDTLESKYPVLRGTIRDQVTHQRRAFIRFFACSEDLTHDESDALLPAEVIEGKEPLRIVGAIAGG